MFPDFNHDDEDFPRSHGGHGPGDPNGPGFGGPGPGGFGGFGSGGFGGGRGRHGRPSGPGGFGDFSGGPFDPNALAAMFRRMTGGRGGHGRRMGRGDVRQAVLALLLEEPMHGYQIIRELDERSGGAWKPSAGSVYPTLQMLADEGLIVADETGGKKVYTLTDEGRAEAESRSDEQAPWETAAGAGQNRFGGELPKASAKLAQAVAQVVRSGDPQQVKAVTEIVDEARRRVYQVLADD